VKHSEHDLYNLAPILDTQNSTELFFF